MICFIRPSNIRITPAFDRVIECNNLLEKNICITVIQWLKSGEKVGSSLEKITYCNYYGERTIKGYFGWFFFIFGNLRKKQPHYIHTFFFLNWFEKKKI